MSAAEASKTFRTAVDGWMGAILLSVPLIVIIVTVALALDKPDEVWVMLIVLAFLGALGWGVVWPITYTVGDTHLTIRAGRLRTRIPFGDIIAVSPSKNILSSPALSMNRLKIAYGKTWVLISPKDRAGFLDALEAGTGLARDGEQLGPKDA